MADASTRDDPSGQGPDASGADRAGQDTSKPGGGPSKSDDKKPDDKKPSPFKNPKVLLITGVVVLVLVAGAVLFWLNARNYESTDDAFVDVQIVRLAPQISGLVTKVEVDDNQRVSAGQPLVEIDSAQAQTQVADAQAKEAQAQSQVDDARVQISVAEAGYEQALADVASAGAQAEQAARDLARYKALQATNPQAVAQQQFDQAEAQATSAAAQRDSALKAAKAKQAQIVAAQTQVKSGEEQVKAAQSELQAANINYGYAHVVAPVDGTIAQKTIAAGNYVQPGAQMMAIVPLNVWVTANFKETQLDLMRPGQPVAIKIDACAHAKIDGHVDSIQRGAGQAFGILPPENATGNYVKVVQRVPVKIVLDQIPRDCPVGPGMSVEPTVKVR
jgi:membrane fusion protein (multidrug efflux system)